MVRNRIKTYKQFSTVNFQLKFCFCFPFSTWCKSRCLISGECLVWIMYTAITGGGNGIDVVVDRQNAEVATGF